MSFCPKPDNSKDKVMFLTKTDLTAPSSLKMKEEEEFDPWEQHGLILPNGSINWDCPCLGGMASGPCGFAFRRAFTCFRNSDPTSKGAECLGEFSALTECFSKYPKLYGAKEKSSTENSNASTAATIADAMNHPN